jgi:hypothetical protein
MSNISCKSKKKTLDALKKAKKKGAESKRKENTYSEYLIIKSVKRWTIKNRKVQNPKEKKKKTPKKK